MILPESTEKLARWSEEIIRRCRNSVSARAALARSLRTWTYTGSPDGNTSILNRMYHHLARMSSYLYSPNDLRFNIDFTHHYDKSTLDQAAIASKVLTRAFEQRDIDIQFGQGVFIGLQHGACIPKLMDGKGGITCKLVMPWQFSVYREDKTDFNEQEAVCETNYITPFELWRRISHLPNAPDLFRRATAYAKRSRGQDDDMTFFHQVLIAGTPPVVQTDPPYTTQPGGLVNVTADLTGAMLAPDVQDELICVHELWVWDDEGAGGEGDYTTIQMAEPDILIAPRYRRKNYFVPEYLPYGLIRPNWLPDNFWGRSEITDLMKLQHLLRDRLEDIKKMMSLQYDRLFYFSGNSGMTDEMYDAMREAGFFAGEAGSDVKDITPQLPKEWAQDVQEILTFMDEVSGFANILSGQGEPGVRAGNHAETLLRTASPRLRDRALLVERQCADFADKAFHLLAAKEAKAYWPKDGQEFLLSQIPEDMRITVDSHSSSPIYEQDHKEIAAFLAKLQVIDGESLLDLLPVPMRDILKARYQEMQQMKKAEMEKLKQELPPHEFLKVITGGKKR